MRKFNVVFDIGSPNQSKQIASIFQVGMLLFKPDSIKLASMANLEHQGTAAESILNIARDCLAASSPSVRVWPNRGWIVITDGPTIYTHPGHRVTAKPNARPTDIYTFLEGGIIRRTIAYGEDDTAQEIQHVDPREAESLLTMVQQSYVDQDFSSRPTLLANLK